MASVAEPATLGKILVTVEAAQSGDPVRQSPTAVPHSQVQSLPAHSCTLLLFSHPHTILQPDVLLAAILNLLWLDF